MTVVDSRALTPSFFLFGEAPRLAGAGFLHVEPLDARSRPNGWSIRMHRHEDLNHIFLVTSGGGRLITADATAKAFRAPCLLFIPAATAHGFALERESTGQVLTVASRYLERRPACEEALELLFQTPGDIACGPALPRLQQDFAELARELGWSAPGHAAAVDARLLDILVAALRLQHQARAPCAGDGGRDAILVARFREAVEARFREHPPLADYARGLGISASHLHHACRRAAGATPLGIVRERVALEAKRRLLYSDVGVAELAFDLGFSDAAYFSRFFAKAAGMSARAFRAAGGSTIT